jgi:ankyrin repeat protein
MHDTIMASLIDAVRTGNIEAVRGFIEAGEDVDTYGVLMATQFNKDTSILQLLLDFGADVNNFGNAALIDMVKGNKIDTVRLLISSGIDIRGYTGVNIAEIAAIEGYFAILEILLNTGVDTSNISLIRPVQGHRYEEVRILIDAGARVSNQSLMAAVRGGSAGMVLLLIKHGGDAQNVVNDAAKYGDRDVFDIIAPLCTDLSTAANTAAKYGKVEILKSLKGAGIDLTADDNKLLRDAAKEGQNNAVSYLIKCGADIHIYDDYPLRIATKQGHILLTKILLEAGADLSGKNHSAMKQAVRYNHYNMVKFLEDYTKSEPFYRYKYWDGNLYIFFSSEGGNIKGYNVWCGGQYPNLDFIARNQPKFYKPKSARSVM